MERLIHEKVVEHHVSPMKELHGVIKLIASYGYRLLDELLRNPRHQ